MDPRGRRMRMMGAWQKFMLRIDLGIWGEMKARRLGVDGRRSTGVRRRGFTRYSRQGGKEDGGM